jgi:hypothetical protein
MGNIYFTVQKHDKSKRFSNLEILRTLRTALGADPAFYDENEQRVVTTMAKHSEITRLIQRAAESEAISRDVLIALVQASQAIALAEYEYKKTCKALKPKDNSVQVSRRPRLDMVDLEPSKVDKPLVSKRFSRIEI